MIVGFLVVFWAPWQGVRNLVFVPNPPRTCLEQKPTSPTLGRPARDTRTKQPPTRCQGLSSQVYVTAVGRLMGKHESTVTNAAHLLRAHNVVVGRDSRLRSVMSLASARKNDSRFSNLSNTSTWKIELPDAFRKCPVFDA